MSVIVKVHKKDERTVIAVCDKTILGQTFEEGNKQLNLASPFYQGDELDNQEAGDLIRNADIVNLVGEEAIKLGLQEEIIDNDHILTIDGIPHAQAILIHED